MIRTTARVTRAEDSARIIRALKAGKNFAWDDAKLKKGLKQSGSRTVFTSNSATFLDILKRSRHACQLIFVVDRENLAFLVTFVETITRPCTPAREVRAPGTPP